MVQELRRSDTIGVTFELTLEDAIALSSVPHLLSRVAVKVRLAISLISLLLLPGIGQMRQTTNAWAGDRQEVGVAAIATPAPRSVEIGRDRTTPFNGRSASEHDRSLSVEPFRLTDTRTACDIADARSIESRTDPVSICGYRATAPPLPIRPRA